MRHERTPRSQDGGDWVTFIFDNIRLLLFLGLGLFGMFFVYWYFTPVGGSATAVAVGDTPFVTENEVEQPQKPVTQRFSQSQAPLFIGIIAGHFESDSGAVCDDGLTEAEINMDIATKLVNRLNNSGIPAAILAEFDTRLDGFSGTALISIHADSCVYINDLATGYKVAGSSYTDSDTLQTCIENSYAAATQLSYHANTITEDMTDYHAFRKISLGTPAVIVETGYMNLDRTLLTTNNEIVVNGLYNGIACYLERSQ